MRNKILSLLFLSIVAFITVPIVEAQTSEKYGLTKRINPKTGAEYPCSETVEISFSGNSIIFSKSSIGNGFWSQQYGVFSNYQNGNKIYSARVRGNSMLGGVFDKKDDCDVGGAYYVVSPDNLIVNKVCLDNVGQPSYIYVYRKANTNAIEQIYR